MKKLLFLLLLAANLCSAQNSTTTIDFDNGPKGTAEAPCQGTSECFFGTGFRTINGIPIRATHGCPDVGYALFLTSFVSVDPGTAGTPWGSGIAIQYPFKAGYRYKISTTGAANSSMLQYQMTNSLTFASNMCTFRTPEVDILSTTNPSAYVTSANTFVELTPTQCYDYLWLSALRLPNTSGGSVHLETLTIEQIANFTIESTTTNLCSSGTYELKFNGQAYTGNVSWGITNIYPASGTIVSANINGSQIGLNKVNDGVIKLSATVQPCTGQSYTVERTFQVGVPPPSHIYKIFDYCYGGTDWEYLIQAEPTFPGLEYVWIKFGYEFPATTNSSFYGYEFPAECVTIDLKTKNACGTSTALSVINGYPATFCPLCGGGYRFSISPNPVRDQVTITVQGKPKNITIRQLIIADKYGRERRNQRVGLNQSTIMVSTSGLEPGTYTIKLFDGKTWTAQQFIKL
jgi:hypothetical protein